MKLSAFVALIVGFPLIAVQIWLFVAPGLYRHEKRAFVPFLVATPFMFYAGCALMYYVVLPYVIKLHADAVRAAGHREDPEIVRLSRTHPAARLRIRFRLRGARPADLLIQVGIATTEGLKSKRRYAIVVAFVIAAVLAPPDVVSQIALAIPLMAFYEISILIGGVIERKRAAADKAAEEAEQKARKPPRPARDPAASHA